MDPFASTDPLLKDYISKAQTANQMGASSMTLPDLLKKTLQTKLADSPIVQERTDAAGNFLRELGNAPTTVTPEATGGVVLDPTQQASLISARRASALMPLLSANQRYDLMTGSLGDLVSQAGNIYGAQAKQAQGEATLSGDIYKTTLDKLLKQEELNIKKQALSAKTTTSTQKITQKKLESISSIDLALSRLQEARNKTVKGASGIIPGLRSGAQSLVGGGLPENVAALRTALSNLNKGIFDTSGKAFTKGEADLLAGTIGKVKDDPALLNQIYDGMEKDLLTRKGLLLSGEYINPEWGISTSDTTSNNSEQLILDSLGL